jgi:SAM-dependent methyltransferase
MNTLDKNLEQWTKFDWEGTGQRGDRWSGGFGSPEAQWYFSIYPRIHGLLPATAICEIAPGFGRWTQFLLQYSESLVALDLVERCVLACRKRFEHDSRASFVLNDGLHLIGVVDESIDFVFSMDSLVHCDRLVVESYIAEALRVLKPNGVAFFHHSNLGATPGATKDNRYPMHWRAPDVSADGVRAAIAKAGGQAYTQELVNWSGSPYLLDCYTVFGRRTGEEFRRVENFYHEREMELVRAIQSLYCGQNNTPGSKPSFHSILHRFRRKWRDEGTGHSWRRRR